MKEEYNFWIQKLIWEIEYQAVKNNDQEILNELKKMQRIINVRKEEKNK